jgi:hypothetical protein
MGFATRLWPLSQINKFRTLEKELGSYVSQGSRINKGRNAIYNRIRPEIPPLQLSQPLKGL